MILKKYHLFLESKKDMWDIIPQSVKNLHLLFKSSGKKLYVVGGSVRDFLNNEKPKDFDLATDATPNEVLEIVGDKYKTTQQGKSFGVIVVYTDDQPKGMEVTTFREDQYNDKLGLTRNPYVKFSTIEKDVERRDIPYNALFYDLENRKIIDLVGGQEDLKNKKTRFVGNPDLRIEEDSLRILRLFRFNCRYQFDIDEETAKSIMRNKNKLNIISRERIWSLSGDNTGEIMKAWKQAKNFTEYLELFNRFDMWDTILPDLKINKEIKDTKYLEIYIANILCENDPEKLMRKLVYDFKIEIDFVRKVSFLISLLNLTYDNVVELYKKKVVAKVDNDMILEWYRIKNIDDKISLSFLKYKPSVSAEDLMSKGFKGPELGKEIKRLEIEKFKNI